MEINLPLAELALQIQAFDKDACIRELHGVPHLKLDFTDDYLGDMPLESLRHVLMAAVLQSRKHLHAA